MQVTRQAILRNRRSYQCLDTKSHWKWRRGLEMYCISSNDNCSYITATLKQLRRLVLLSSFLCILRQEKFSRKLKKTPCFIMQLVISRRSLANCATCIVVKMESLIFLDDFTKGIMLAFFARYMLQMGEMKFKLDFCFILLYFILLYLLFSILCPVIVPFQ